MIDATTVLEAESRLPLPFFGSSSKPYTRWWWLAGPFRREDIEHQLDWLKANGFGGVELAWLWPSWLDRPGKIPAGPRWLGEEWSELVAFTKRHADKIGLGCDFTFGSSWPFGGSCVGTDDAAQTFKGLSGQRLEGSWEDRSGEPLRVLNHLSRRALENYAAAMIPAFAGALTGSRSALFCDSLELDTEKMWSPELWDRFAERFGYRLEEYKGSLDTHPEVRYDYRKLIAETIVEEFYRAFSDISHRHGAIARVQCHGAPADLLAAYAAVDVPESEALLFEPHFSRIPASAAALSGKPVVSAETFTSIYGFITASFRRPLLYWKREQVADLKLLADAIFAHGVNQIVWHGMPFNPPGGTNEFYASVHVGPDACFAQELPAFNRYLETVSTVLKLGHSYSDLALYLPNEDHWMLGRIPRDQRTPGANHLWEMRHVVIPAETEGFHPLWISYRFLKQATCAGGRMHLGDVSFSTLYVDCEWVDHQSLLEILRLARAGLSVVVKQQPQQPGKVKHVDYRSMVDELLDLPNVTDRLSQTGITPLVAGRDLPWFWARVSEYFTYIFFAHPKAVTCVTPWYTVSRAVASTRRGGFPFV